MEISSNKIIIDDEFRNLIPKLSDVEFNQLEENILKNGVLDAVCLWNYTIVDGHNRFAISQKHKLDCDFIQLNFADKNEAKIWIIQNQFGRRNISAYSRAELALELEKNIAEKAKQNQGIRNDISPILAESSQIDTREELSKMAGVSHGNISKVKVIKNNANEEIKTQLRNGETTINKVFTDILREQKAEQRKAEIQTIKNNSAQDDSFINGDCLTELLLLADGSVDCVITDPPYGIDYVSNHRVIENNVDREIANDTKQKALELWERTCVVLFSKMAQNSHLYCFTSWKVYPEFKAITERYFKIKNCLIWEKNNWSMGDLDGNYAEQYEMIIFATKGNKKLNGGRNTNILHFDRVANSKLLHSCEKPIPLLEHLLSKSTSENDLVVDMFAGSATTLKACKNTNRRYWGCEIDKENYEIGLGRLNGDT